jgi:hypothetical protein
MGLKSRLDTIQVKKEIKGQKGRTGGWMKRENSVRNPGELR